MDRNKIDLQIDNVSESLLLHYASPNKELVAEILGFDASQLDSLQNDVLSTYILVMGQYLVMLQHNENLKNIAHMLSSKHFEFKLNVDKFTRDDVTQKTEKERKAYIIQTNEEIANLNEGVITAEAEKMLLSGMVKVAADLLNALKKEKSGRDGN